ncbi:NAD(P)-binding protein [Heliocybe sulcata]|uniref:NAD(P)-binding protein n=1 Tax=Heliocybe sulcata TaxID=5364 RepID=A0A5C3NK48_9AGAM|nr:NAD(P)-binding protein [Heliocybe sulcata]
MAPPRYPGDINITHRQDVYPGIDINGRLKGAAQGKIVYITGASRGIGAATALAYARAGCRGLFLTSTSRSAADLQAVGQSLRAQVPGVEVEVCVADVTDEKAVKSSVDKCIEKFGRINVVIANAGYLEKWTKIGEIDPSEWWLSFVRGTFSVIHHSIRHLVATKGHAVLLSSGLAQILNPGSSGYATAKHALNRLAEFIQVEYGVEGVKVFSINPGGILTALSSNEPWLPPHMTDTVELASQSMVRLTSGTEDWLSGRYVNFQWDLDELETKRKDIEEKDLLKNKLDVGSLA